MKLEPSATCCIDSGGDAGGARGSTADRCGCIIFALLVRMKLEPSPSCCSGHKKGARRATLDASQHGNAIKDDNGRREKAQEDKGQDDAKGEKKESEIDIKGPEGQP